MSLLLMPPSSMKAVWSTTVPPALPSGLTPGCMVTNELESRPSVGKFCRASPETVLPIVEFRVCSSEPVTLTSTSSVTPPTLSGTLAVTCWPTSTFRFATLPWENPGVLDRKVIGPWWNICENVASGIIGGSRTACVGRLVGEREVHTTDDSARGVLHRPNNRSGVNRLGGAGTRAEDHIYREHQQCYREIRVLIASRGGFRVEYRGQEPR